MSEDKVKCQLCGKKYKIISPTHLGRAHNMTVKEYKEKFPDANLVPDKQLENLRRMSKKSHRKFSDSARESVVDIEFLEGQKKEEEKAEEKVEKKEDREITIKKSDEEIFSEIDKTKQKKPVVLATETYHEELTRRLIEAFPDIKPNYEVRKINQMGRALEYSYVLDYAFPDHKIAIEFIDSYFYNGLHIDRETKIRLLSADGWDILTIKGSIPRISTVVKEIKKFV